MNQAEIRKLIPALRVAMTPKKRRFSNPRGPEGRLFKMRTTVNELIKNERMEVNYNRADEARGYAERLISEAIRYGDCHRPTMELADFWLPEKQNVHKLFKVLVPRFKDSEISYTRVHKAPHVYPSTLFDKVVLELRGNPFPPLEKLTTKRNWIHNILLEEAHREYLEKKYKQEGEEEEEVQ